MQKIEPVKVAIIATHPIQYQVPWFIELAKQDAIDLTVYYTLIPDEKQQGIGFGIPFTWDIPLLDGYAWKLLPNRNKTRGLLAFFKNSMSAVYEEFSVIRPDVVIITGWHSLALLQTLWVCMRLHIPRIVRGDSNAMRYRSLPVKFLHRLLLSTFTAYLSVGIANSDFYHMYGVPATRIFNCRHFVDNRRFREQCAKTAKKRYFFRTNWNIPNDAICFLFVGKLQPVKCIFDLIYALEKVRATINKIHLLMVGSGELMADAKKIVTSLNLPVTFTGFLNQSEITSAYVASDCIVLPSNYETWGLVINEAMACGLPAVVSDRVGCGPDLVESNVTGHVFPFGDIDELADKLTDIARNTAKRKQLGENASARIQEYSVERAIDGTLQAIYYSLSVHQKDRKAARGENRPA